MPGDVSMYDPVGTPPKPGRPAFEAPWDTMNAPWALSIEHLVVNGTEAAVLMRNVGEVGGTGVVLPSIEIWRFGDDGSLHARFSFETPAADDAERVRRDEIRTIMERAHELWNAHDRDAWLEVWREAVPGDMTLDDRATGEVRHGFDECRVETWEIHNATTRFATRFLVVCGNEAAMAVDNVIDLGPQSVTVTSIETYEFGDDASLYERNWYDLPAS